MAVLPDVTLREAGEVVRLAVETGARIGGEIDPQDVEGIAAVPEEAS